MKLVLFIPKRMSLLESEKSDNKDKESKNENVSVEEILHILSIFNTSISQFLYCHCIQITCNILL